MIKRKREMSKLKSKVSAGKLNWVDMVKYDKSTLLQSKMMNLLRKKGLFFYLST